MTRESASTTLLHFDRVQIQSFVTTVVSSPHVAHCLDVCEHCGNGVHIFLTDSQLRQLLAAINERLGLVSVDDNAKAAEVMA